jgi:diamine N-acetyltransferase
MSESVRLRRAEPGDEAALALIGRATFLDRYADLLPVADILAHCEHKHSPEVYRQWLISEDHVCWLVEIEPGHTPVGYLVLGPSTLPVTDSAATDREIIRIYLLHRFQRRGLGRRLMECAVEAALTAGGKRLLLGVYSRNESALAFYAQQGFTRVGERTFRVGTSEYYDYVLGLDLRGSLRNL